MFELKAMTYEESRKKYFEELKADAVRKMEYWSKRVDKDGPWNPRVRAYVYANEWGAVVNYLNDALKALEVMPKDGDMRLIDADALIEKCIENLNDDEVFDRIPPDYVDDAPTIDAEPVRHGKWMICYYNEESKEHESVTYNPYTFRNPDGAMFCSECGLDALRNVHAEHVSSAWCPHCGAVMDLNEVECK